MKWYIKFPADAYALGPVPANNKREARAYAREWAGVSRLPNGFACWEA